MKINVAIAVFFALITALHPVRSQDVSGSDNSGFTIPQIPLLSSTLQFSDSTSDNVLEPGERGKFIIHVKNSGMGPAYAVSVRIRQLDIYDGITVGARQTIDSIAPESILSIEIPVSASKDIAAGIMRVQSELRDEQNQLIDTSVTLAVDIRSAPKYKQAIADTRPPAIEMIKPFSGTKAPDSTITTTEPQIQIHGIAKDDKGVAIVRVNGRDAILVATKDKDGVEFRSDALLTIGEDSIVIEAVDKSYNVSTVNFRVLRLPQKAIVTVKNPQLKKLKDRKIYAAVIGISNYEDTTNINQLKYAHKDAEDFYEFLVTPPEKGGMGVALENTRKFTNEKATKVNILKAICDFPKRAGEDDIVIIYFAGHGAVDPDVSRIPYLLAYDSDLDAITATSVKMSEIYSTIQEIYTAKRVVAFIDACHSGGASRSVAMNTRGSLQASDQEIINKYLGAIALSGKTMLIFSATEGRELSQESPKWGGGHGVFTYFLLRGLQGEANVPDEDGSIDELVRLGELVDYVRNKVEVETNRRQHPQVSAADWDRNFPMSVDTRKK